MNKYFTLLLFVFLICYSTILFSQQNSKNDSWMEYNADKKSELVAGVFEFMIPVVGHVYAGDVMPGVIPAVVSYTGIILSIYGPDLILQSSEDYVYYVGPLLFLAGRIWGIASVFNSVEDYNSNLKRRLNLTFHSMKFPQGNIGYGITISYNF